MEFYYLPEELRVMHTACFELIRQIEEFIVGKDYQFLQITSSILPGDVLPGDGFLAAIAKRHN